jgi:hypothetical protein
LEFEGATENLKLPSTPQLGKQIKITSAPIEINYQIHHAAFADNPINIESTPTTIDVILYNGPEKQINFAEIEEAAVIFTLQVVDSDPAPVQNSQLSLVNNQSKLAANFHRSGKLKMSLTVPTNPLPNKPQRKASKATLANINPWKISGH